MLTLSICLSHDTADACLELLAQKNHEVTMVSSAVLEECVANADEVARFGSFTRSLGVDWPDVLVTRDDRRRANARVTCHKWSGRVPEGSVVGIEEGLYVSSPAFCLLQQAGRLHFVSLCQMLGRFLATEAPSMEGGKEFDLCERRPLITEEELALYLREARGARGVGSLRKALAYTCAGSASPQETNLQLILSLPTRLGGFGLPLPTMNYVVTPSAEAMQMYPKTHYRIDLYWRGTNFGLEYQGEEHSETMGADMSRWYALMATGEETWFVTDDQMGSSPQLRFIAGEVARRLGIAGAPQPQEAALQELLRLIRMGPVYKKRG